MILVSLRILTLLWLINFAPPLLAHFLEDKWNTPIDLGRVFKDGRPILGSHKTVRGVLGAVAAGALVAPLLGFPWWIGLLAGTLSMLGDLLTSFLKRRMDQPSGSLAPGLDQLFEGVLPFVALGPYHALSLWNAALLAALFGLGAYWGSVFLKKVLLTRPEQYYPRPLRSRVRLKELRRCHLPLTRFHYWLNFQDAFYYHIFMKGTFRLLGIYEKGVHNALQIQERQVTLVFDGLPEAFDGYKIIYMSDLHLDGLDGLTEKLQSILRSTSADLCLLGGDIRMETYGPMDEALSRCFRLLPEIKAQDGIYGVLGNHDCIEMIPQLREAGLTILVNEAVSIERGTERIWIVGIDDPHHFQCHDLVHAFDRVPENEFVIFMSHSPEVYREAADLGARLYLCGHTHAGQIQIAPLGPIFTHSRTGRRFSQGVWEYQGMQGYTSSGVGVSGVPVRFFSHGEVVTVALKKSRRVE
jgi:hypothetical protein